MSFEQSKSNSVENIGGIFTQVESFSKDLTYMSNKSGDVIKIKNIADQTNVTESAVIALASVSKLKENYVLIFKMQDGQKFRIENQGPKALHRVIEILNSQELEDFYAEKKPEEKGVTKLMKAVPGFKAETPQVIIDYCLGKQSGTLSLETAKKIAAMTKTTGDTIQELVDKYRQ